MVTVGTGTSGTRFLQTKWPNTYGMTAGTTKLYLPGSADRTLISEDKFILQSERLGLDG